MGYRLNRHDEPVLIAVSKPLLTEFSIHHRLESCANQNKAYLMECLPASEAVDFAA